ncbi:PREDICTED: uncharacterized protein LOC108503882 [Lepidothrix coronata]|uniref:Uncharacterized protein LOC108503882 n=1 Tax=Lepidothrix coronata TaxID=321398 RepID=A0A6J0IAU0_9PASS|nr:PREDICTED: uncharacterized protein LOC108503882 [Lepidothrix coronata]XP_017683782.1 PREDICTED: uncharacterized protein LOC108503882 [Lepidothrix coronata]
MANTVLKTQVETREDEEVSPQKNFEEENEYYRLESVPIAFEEPEKTSPGGKGLRKRAKKATTGTTVRAANGANMPKRKPSPDEEPKKETTPDEESEDENESTDGEPKKTSPGGKPGNNNSPGGKGWKKRAKRAAIGAAIGAGVALVAVPAFVAGLGFTAGGIAAGSIAAKMMSAAAIANGGGVAAGSTVAVLQSIGAVGFSTGTTAVLTTGLGSLGAAAGASLPVEKKDSGDKPKKS